MKNKIKTEGYMLEKVDKNENGCNEWWKKELESISVKGTAITLIVSIWEEDVC